MRSRRRTGPKHGKREDDTDRLVNNKVFSDTIQNFSTTPYRRVDLTALISNSVDVESDMRHLQKIIKAAQARLEAYRKNFPDDPEFEP